MRKVTRQATMAYTTTGGVCVADNLERKENNVVKEYVSGNTRIKVCDDYCYNCTPKEVDEILKRIASRTQKQLSAQG